MDENSVTTSVTLRAHKNCPGSAWAARIADDGSRKFLEPIKTVLSRAGTGTKTFDLGEEGYYEVEQVESSTRGTTSRTCYRAQSRTLEVVERTEVPGLVAFDTQIEARKRARERSTEATRTAIAERYSLPALSGSPKQIAWAESIRATALVHANRAAERDPSLTPYLETLIAQKESRWWLDHRGETGDWLLRSERNRDRLKKALRERDDLCDRTRQQVAALVAVGDCATPVARLLLSELGYED